MEKDWRTTIAALLAKANNPAATKAEQETYTQHAMYLMAKFGIEEHQLRVTNKQSVKAVMKSFKLTNPYVTHKGKLITGIARAFGTKPVYINKNDVRVIGLPEDIARVELLFASLLMQLFIGLKAAEADKPYWEHGKTFKHSWVLGFVSTVVQRVQDAAHRATTEAKASTPGTDLVLADRKSLVDAKVAKLFPNLTTYRRSTANNSTSGRALGAEAGRRADIGHPRLGGSRRSVGA